MEPSPATTRPRPWMPHLLAIGCYLLLTAVVTYPLPLRLSSQIIANEPGQVDGYLGVWNVWWTARAITTGHDPYLTPLLFYPQGLDLFWQTLSLPQGLLALPFTLALGPLPAYNLLILAGFVLGGYFAFLFIRAVLRDKNDRPTVLAAIVGGAVYAFAPFHMQKVLDAQLEVASIQWLPLWAWATLTLLERRHWPWALLAALALLWVGLGTWYYGLFALIATGAMAGLWAIQEGRGQKAESWPIPGSSFILHPSSFLWGLSPLVLWLLMMAPRLISLAQTGDTLLGDARLEQQDAIADLIAFWLPNPNHPLWGAAVSSFYESIHPGEILWNVALGLIGTLLAVVGLAVAWRAHWRWFALGLLAALFALGAELFIVGIGTGIPMPYELIRHLPGVRASHRPNHFVLITILTTALFAAVGARQLFHFRPRAAAPLAAGLLTAIVAIDGLAAPLPMFARPVPAPYLQMPPPDGALLPVPLHINFSNSENLWYQTFHGWPIIGGFIGREPPYPLAEYASGIKELRFGRVEREDILSPGWPELARETLAAYQIRSVMFHKPAMGSTVPLMREIIAEMGLAPTYDDELIGVYPVPAPPAVRPLAYLGAGWGRLERDSETRWRWMGERAEIYLLNPTAAPRPIRLTLELEAFEQARTLTLRLGNGAPFSIEVSRARMERTIKLILPPGEHMLYLDAPAGSPPGQPERRLSLAVLGIKIE